MVIKVSTAKRPAAPLAAPSAAPPTEAGRETGTVRRVLLMLTELAEHPGDNSSAMAQRLNLPRSTAHRLLSMLRDDGFAAQAADGSFSPGAELHRLAGRVRATMPITELAMPLMQALSTRFGETSILALLTQPALGMYFAATASPPDPMRYNVELNRTQSLAWGATARVLLAHLPAADIEAVVRRAEKSPVGDKALDAAALMKELAQIRKNGWAISHGHRTRNAVGVAAPFFDSHGRVAGDIAFLIPEARFARHTRQALTTALREAADEMSRRLGHVA